MRIAQSVFLAVFAAANVSFAQSDSRDSRYSGAPSAPSSSGNRFSDLFSTESSRGGERPPAATRSATAQNSGASSIELRPLRKSQPPAASPRQPTASALSPPPRTTAGDNRPGRYAGGAPTRAPSNTFSPGSLTRDGGTPVERSISVGGRRESAAYAMLTDMLKAPANSRLRGTPTRLASAVARASTREEQGRVVEAYWALAAASIDYYLGLAEADELGRLRQRVPTYSAALSEALAGLNSRVDTSLKAAQAAQLRLGNLMGGGARPLPVDIPFVGPYATRFEQNFPGGGAEEARLLNELLPARLSELYAAVEAVERSNNWLSKVANSRSAGDGAGMIRALELVALNRRAFVMLARDYNLQINRYTQLTSPGQLIDTGRLVAMLIRTGGAASNLGGALADGGALEFRSGAASRR